MAEAAAEAFLRDYPELRPFVLTDVQLTGTRIGCGAFGNVDEVAVPVVAAAKTIHAILQEGDGTGIVPKALTEYVRECQLMSTLRHPNIVQFLGVAFFRNSRLPALVMERLLTSIHDLLDPQEAYPPPPPDTPTALSFFTMDLKVSVLHDVACGLAYLHEQLPPIIHRDLSARNILLNTKMVAKITDLGVACIMPRMRAATNLSVGPGAIVYMPPEVFNHSGERSKYDASIDIFAFGVVTIFTIGENFPCDILPPTYVDEKSGLVRSRTELQRRSEYMRDVNDQLRARGQLRGDHPLIRLIQQCLQNVPAKRPGIREVLHQLEDARAGFRDKTSERNKRELIRALQMHPIKHNLEHILEDLVVDNADIHSRLQTMEKELQNKEEQIRTCEWEKHRIRQGAEETIRREQLQIQEMRQREAELVQAKDREIADIQQQLREKEEQLRCSEGLLVDLRRMQQMKQSPAQPTEPVLPQVHQRSPRKPEVLQIDKADIQYGALLGRGGSAAVFSGFWKSKGIRVALKKVQISPEECDAKILAELGEHPNIISFFGLFYDFPDTTVVTALAANGSLYDYLHKDGNTPTLGQSLKWARQIAYGMAHIHKLGIVHRDLKSSNVLFNEDMETQICDFGVSRSMPNTTEISKEAGTRRWMAPEIVKQEKVNMMCDVFSFSMVVWELMEHKVPFHDLPSDILASMRIIEGQRPPIASEWPDYLVRLTVSGWSDNPYERPSFADIITSLENRVYFRH